MYVYMHACMCLPKPIPHNGLYYFSWSSSCVPPLFLLLFSPHLPSLLPILTSLYFPPLLHASSSFPLHPPYLPIFLIFHLLSPSFPSSSFPPHTFPPRTAF